MARDNGWTHTLGLLTFEESGHLSSWLSSVARSCVTLDKSLLSSGTGFLPGGCSNILKSLPIVQVPRSILFTMALPRDSSNLRETYPFVLRGWSEERKQSPLRAPGPTSLRARCYFRDSSVLGGHPAALRQSGSRHGPFPTRCGRGAE